MAIDPSLENYDDDEIPDFSREDFMPPSMKPVSTPKPTKDRKPSFPIGQATAEFGKGLAEGVGQAVAIEATNMMPKTASVVDEVKSTFSDINQMRKDMMTGIQPALTSMENTAGKLLPATKRLMPKRLYDKINNKLTSRREEREMIARYGSTQDQGALDTEKITSELSSIFSDQMEYDEARQAEERQTNMMNQTLESIRSSRIDDRLASIYTSTRFQATFLKTTYTAYLKKSLELKYRTLFLTRDLLGTLSNTARVMESNLVIIAKNTGLPETQKITNFERAADAMRNQLYGGFGQRAASYISNFRTEIMKRVKSKVFDSIKSGMGTMSMLLGSAAEANSMLSGDGGMGDMDFEDVEYDDNGDPIPKKKKRELTMGQKLVANVLGQLVGSFGAGPAIAKGLSSKFGAIANDFEGSLGDAKANLIMKVSNWRSKHQNDSGWKGMLADMIPTYNSTSTGSNVLLNNGNDPAIYDNITRQSIVEIIPGWLGKIHNEIAKIKTPDAEEEVFDYYSRSFAPVSEMRSRLFDKMMLTTKDRTRHLDKAVGILKSGYTDSKVEKVKAIDFDTYSDDIMRFLLNLANNHEMLDTDALQLYLDSINESNPTGYVTGYVERNGAGIEPGRLPYVAQLLVGGVQTEGIVDVRRKNRLGTAINQQAVADSYKDDLPKYMEARGQRRFFTDIIDHNNKINMTPIIAEQLRGERIEMQSRAEAARKETSHRVAESNVVRSDAMNSFNNAREWVGNTSADVLEEIDSLAQKVGWNTGLDDKAKRFRTYMGRGGKAQQDMSAFLNRNGVLTGNEHYLPFGVLQSDEHKDKDWLSPDTIAEYMFYHQDEIGRSLERARRNNAKKGPIPEFLKRQFQRGKNAAQTAGGNIRDMYNRNDGNLHAMGQEAYDKLSDAAKRAYDESKIPPYLRRTYDEHVPESVKTKVDQAAATVSNAATHTADEVRHLFIVPQPLDAETSTLSDVLQEPVGESEEATYRALPAKWKQQIIDKLKDAKVEERFLIMQAQLRLLYEEGRQAAREEAQELRDKHGSVFDLDGMKSGLRAKYEAGKNKLKGLFSKHGNAVAEKLEDARNQAALRWTQLREQAELAAKAVADKIKGTPDDDTSDKKKKEELPSDFYQEWKTQHLEKLDALLGEVSASNTIMAELLLKGIGGGKGYNSRLDALGSLVGEGLSKGVKGAKYVADKYFGLYGTAIRATGSIVGGIFGSDGPYQDIYRKDNVDIGHPLLSRTKQATAPGVVFADTGKRVEKSKDIDRPVVDPATGQTLITEEDLQHGLVTMSNKPIAGALQSSIFAAGKAISGVAGAAASIANSYVKALGMVGKGMLNTANFLFKKNGVDVPYYNIYLKDQIITSKPLLSRRKQEEGVFFKSGTKVARTEDILEPVYDTEGNCLVTDEDLKHGLVAVDNKPIGVPRGNGGGSLFSRGLFGAFKGVKDILVGGGSLAGGIASMYGKFYSGLFGVLGTGISKAFSAVFGPDSKLAKGIFYPVTSRLDNIYNLLDSRLRDQTVEFDNDGSGHRDGSLEDLKNRQQGGVGGYYAPDGTFIPGVPGAPGQGGTTINNVTNNDNGMDLMDYALMSGAGGGLFGMGKRLIGRGVRGVGKFAYKHIGPRLRNMFRYGGKALRGSKNMSRWQAMKRMFSKAPTSAAGKSWIKSTINGARNVGKTSANLWNKSVNAAKYAKNLGGRAWGGIKNIGKIMGKAPGGLRGKVIAGSAAALAGLGTWALTRNPEAEEAATQERLAQEEAVRGKLTTQPVAKEEVKPVERGTLASSAAEATDAAYSTAAVGSLGAMTLKKVAPNVAGKLGGIGKFAGKIAAPLALGAVAAGAIDVARMTPEQRRAYELEVANKGWFDKTVGLAFDPVEQGRTLMATGRAVYDLNEAQNQAAVATQVAKKAMSKQWQLKINRYYKLLDRMQPGPERDEVQKLVKGFEASTPDSDEGYDIGKRIEKLYAAYNTAKEASTKSAAVEATARENTEAVKRGSVIVPEAQLDMVKDTNPNAEAIKRLKEESNKKPPVVTPEEQKRQLDEAVKREVEKRTAMNTGKDDPIKSLTETNNRIFDLLSAIIDGKQGGVNILGIQELINTGKDAAKRTANQVINNTTVVNNPVNPFDQGLDLRKA